MNRTMNMPDVDYMGPQWARVEEWLNSELLETYKRLANLAITDNETHQLRGRAALIGQMLDFRNQIAARNSAAN